MTAASIFSIPRARIPTAKEKLGLALAEFRKDVVIATKSAARTGADLRKDIEVSLRNLGTDYLDLYQLHNPSFVPLPGGEDGLYDTLADLKREGVIRYFGITNHSRQLACEAIDTGLYDTLQYPFSYLADNADIELVKICADTETGFIAMKALAGGLITNIPAAFAWIRQFEGVIPVWGIQKRFELDDFIDLEQHPSALDEILNEGHFSRPEKTLREFLPGLRLLPPVPGEYSDKQREPHVPVIASLAGRAVDHARVAGAHEPDPRLHQMRTLRKALPLRTQAVRDDARSISRTIARS